MGTRHVRPHVLAVQRHIIIPFSIALTNGVVSPLTLKPDAQGQGLIPERLVLSNTATKVGNLVIGGSEYMLKGVSVALSLLENGRYAGQGYWFRYDCRAQPPSFDDNSPFSVDLTGAATATITGVLVGTPASE